MGELRAAIAAARDAGRAAFIPYLTAGDPSLDATGTFVRALAEAGADIIELGIPFSDPIADGPVNQRAAERALAAGTTLAGVLDALETWRAGGFATPVVVFTYFNPVLRMGLETFARRAKAAGAQGALIVDLPPEEAGEWLAAAKAAGVETVFLAAPTTEPERLPAIDAASSGFLYYVSRLGVTGTRDALPLQLAADVAALKAKVTAPVAVGFGISTPEQAALVAAHADAVVVGSALVRVIEERGAGAAADLKELAGSLAEALRR